MAWIVQRTDNVGVARFQVRFRDLAGTKRTAGTYASRREAVKAGRRVDIRVEDGTWINPAAGRITFRDYVEQTWWPSRHLEVSTRAAYRSYLDRHFIPFFGHRPMSSIGPSTVQAWVTQASAEGLSSRSLTKYHVMLHGIFKRAVRDRVILHNPCADTELPKVVPRKVRILTPEEFERLLAEISERFNDLVRTDIETGLRWRAGSTPTPTRRLPPAVALGGRNRRGGVEAQLPHRRAHGVQALPEGRRIPDLAREPRLA